MRRQAFLFVFEHFVIPPSQVSTCTPDCIFFSCNVLVMSWRVKSGDRTKKGSIPSSSSSQVPPQVPFPLSSHSEGLSSSSSSSSSARHEDTRRPYHPPCSHDGDWRRRGDRRRGGSSSERDEHSLYHRRRPTNPSEPPEPPEPSDDPPSSLREGPRKRFNTGNGRRPSYNPMRKGWHSIPYGTIRKMVKNPVPPSPIQLLVSSSRDCVVAPKADGSHALGIIHFDHAGKQPHPVLQVLPLRSDEMISIDFDRSCIVQLEKMDGKHKHLVFDIILANFAIVKRSFDWMSGVLQRLQWLDEILRKRCNSCGIDITELDFWIKPVTQVTGASMLRHVSVKPQTTYPNDGWIVYDEIGDHQYKVKQHDQQTADLLWSDDHGRWEDMDGEFVHYISMDPPPSYEKNGVWRCKWDLKSKQWVALEARDDKPRPNPRGIVRHLERYLTEYRWSPLDLIDLTISREMYYDERCRVLVDVPEIHPKVLKFVGRMRESVIEWILSLECVERGSMLLDIGCGMGKKSSMIAMKCDVGHVVGMDIDPRSISVSQQSSYQKSTDGTKFDWLLCDLNEIPWKSRPWGHDIMEKFASDRPCNVICLFALHFEDEEHSWIAFLSERCLPGSHLFIAMYDRESLNSLCGPTGLYTGQHNLSIRRLEAHQFEFALPWNNLKPMTEKVFTREEIISAFISLGWALIDDTRRNDRDHQWSEFAASGVFLAFRKME
jgi:SAM-dependent methyltransferase